MDNPGHDTQSSEIDRKLTEYPSRLWGYIATSWRSYRSWEPERYSWKISNFGNLTISRESSGNYLTSLITIITYMNTDDRCPLEISPGLVIYISRIGSTSEGDYYKLSMHNVGIQQVPSNIPLNLEHTFSMRTDAPPLLSGTAKCIVRGNVTGEMKLPTGVIKGTLKLDGNNTFNTRVTKEWIRE